MDNQVKTGYPSIDKPWLKYYSQDIIDAPLPDGTLYELVYNNNQDNLERTAIEYYGTSMSYGEMFHTISLLAGSLEFKGVKAGDYVTVCMINSPETICLLLALNKIGAVANMVYGTSTLQELKKYILDTNTKIVFTLDLYQDKFVQIADETGIAQIIVTNLVRIEAINNQTASAFTTTLTAWGSAIALLALSFGSSVTNRDVILGFDVAQSLALIIPVTGLEKIKAGLPFNQTDP